MNHIDFYINRDCILSLYNIRFLGFAYLICLVVLFNSWVGGECGGFVLKRVFEESSSFLLRDSDQIIALKVFVCPFKFMMINKLEQLAESSIGPLAMAKGLINHCGF